MSVSTNSPHLGGQSLKRIASSHHRILASLFLSDTLYTLYILYTYDCAKLRRQQDECSSSVNWFRCTPCPIATLLARTVAGDGPKEELGEAHWLRPCLMQLSISLLRGEK